MFLRSFTDTLYLKADADQLKSINEHRAFVDTYIPGASLSESDKPGSPSPTLSFVTGEDCGLKVAGEGWQFTAPADIKPQALIVVAGHCLEAVRQAAGRYLIHGSAVAVGSGATLFFGAASGIGKTSLAIALARQSGGLFLGDDKIIIDESGMVLGGPDKVHLNKAVLGDKLGLSENISVDAKATQLSRLVMPVIQPGENINVQIDQWDVEKTAFHLYEEASRSIRGVSKRVYNDTYALPSLDTRKLALRRSRAINKLASQVQGVALYGSLDTAVQWLIKGSS